MICAMSGTPLTESENANRFDTSSDNMDRTARKIGKLPASEKLDLGIWEPLARFRHGLVSVKLPVSSKTSAIPAL
jgi:hypothetical protein